MKQKTELESTVLEYFLAFEEVEDQNVKTLSIHKKQILEQMLKDKTPYISDGRFVLKVTDKKLTITEKRK